MVLRCLRAELMKCRRAPVWLAFLVLPLFPAVLGTFNLPGQPGGAGRRLVQPVDPAHPVCLHVLPPRPVRRVLRLAVAAGARRPQLERCPHRPGAQCVRSTWASCCWTWGCPPWPWPSSACSFSSAAGWQVSPPPCPRSCPGWLAFGALGWYGGVRRTALPQSGHPRLRPAGSHRPGGWNLRPAPYQPGPRLRLSLLPALPGYAGQQPPDGPAPPLLSGGCGFYLLLFSLLAVRRLSRRDAVTG